MQDWLRDLVTPENFAQVLTVTMAAIGGGVTWLAGRTLFRARAETPMPQSPEQFAAAHMHNLVKNNEYFAAVGPILASINEHMAVTRANSEKLVADAETIKMELVRGKR